MEDRNKQIRMAQSVNLGQTHVFKMEQSFLVGEFDEEIKKQARRYYKILTELQEEIKLQEEINLKEKELKLEL